MIALRCWIAAFALFCWAGTAFGQSLPEADGTPGGLAYTRTAGPLGTSRTLSFSIPVAERQAISINAGYDQFASFPDDENLDRYGRPTWKLRSVPVGADYVLHLVDPGRRIVPVASAGASLYLSRLSVVQNLGPQAASAETSTDAPAAVPFSALSTARPEKHSEMGMGYDVHAALGLRANVSEHLYLIGQARLRHVDALGFSRDDWAEFNKLDFVVGVGFDF